MPGTLIRDGLAPVLQNGTIAATTTGAAVTVNRPGRVRIKLSTGTVSSTGNSATLDVEIQASDSATFASGNVSLGRFGTLTGTDTAQSSINHYLNCYCGKTYMRAVMTAAGTLPSYGTLAITVNEPNYLRTRADTA